MKLKQFNKKYKKIKMNKYVPNLEKELKKTIDRKILWMEASLEIEEEKNILQDKRKDDKLILKGIFVSLLLILGMEMIGVLIWI